MQAFMFPSTARDLLARSQAFTTAKREEKALKARQAREFEEAAAQCMRLGWDAQGARELAALKVYGVMA